MRARIERMYWQVVCGIVELPRREEGQGLTEYVIILAVAVLVVLAAVTKFGGALTSQFGRLTGQVTGIGP